MRFSHRASLITRHSSLVHKRHGPLILETDDHHFSKASGGHADAGRGELAGEYLEQRARAFGLLGIVEARAAAARDGAGEGELRDGENRAAGIADVAVHPARLVAEDAQ